MRQRTLSRKLQKAIDENKMDIIIQLQPLLEKLLNQKDNFILMSDGYKYSHPKFYESGTEYISSYLESRGSKFEEIVFFALQYYMKKYFAGPVIFTEEIDEAEEHLLQAAGPNVFDRTKFDYIVEKHGGCLPLEIKAVKEGLAIPTKNVLMTIINTDPNCAWLVGFVETVMLQIWYPQSVSTLSRETKKIIAGYLIKTGCSDAMLEYILNDFGFRGVSSVESANIGGAAHLVNGQGSDTTIASAMIRNYYNTDIVYGKTIPATEHSITSQGGIDGELDVFRRVLGAFPKGLLACVSDTFDIFNACNEYWGTILKDEIMLRDGVLIIRPDSGHPVKTLLKVFEILMDKFGFTVNSLGYKVLPSKIRVIQGDGINYDSIKEIYQALTESKIAAENLILGMGGKLLQGCNRDDHNFAFKASHTIVNGIPRNIVKQPIEMDENGIIHKSFKTSKKGLLKLVKDENGRYFTATSEDPLFDSYIDELIPVFKNGVILKEYTFEEVRENAKIGFVPILF